MVKKKPQKHKKDTRKIVTSETKEYLEWAFHQAADLDCLYEVYIEELELPCDDDLTTFLFEKWFNEKFKVE